MDCLLKSDASLTLLATRLISHPAACGEMQWEAISPRLGFAALHGMTH